MPRRFEVFKKTAIRRWRNCHRSKGKIEEPYSKILRYRDKCSRVFSEIQYFTKEILPGKPELVG